ncbi:NAD-dependent epimerase/dehydratase family protein [Haloprofundus salinisoli]|uniref:NAD-dependent epimerase/dehydratase family protein n=1 Tax=Haloprofundus salinisoli TaxID=2876193 RepID=UPI001CCFF7FA|nr:NAD-dependent epimerase/dehydratase family protein [Haloprofundus salinisoli]
MKTALCIGGTRFIGRHTVEELLTHDYDVTTFTRGTHEDPFADRAGVSHIPGDRTDREALASAAAEVDPDVVVDFCAYRPREVETATEVFADSRYVYVSSGSAYARADVPMREDETPIHDCSPEQADDDSAESYGPRKAEGDRAVAVAATESRRVSRSRSASGVSATAEGVEAMSVRPMLVYGPHDYTERFAYWVGRVAEYDRVLVPGDGGSLLHRSYVEDVASALRVVAEEGNPGEAYNVADRNAFSLAESLELVADALDTEVEIVGASDRELAEGGIEPAEFPLYAPRPMLVSTEKLSALGWESTPKTEAVAATAIAHVENGRNGTENGPAREAERRVLDTLDA